MDRPARVHVLYLERAEDQRTADGKRSAGLHLEQTPGLGPYICTTCDAVADTWRNRCDNFQCGLRMCCAEGALFRPSVAQFAVLSPRASLVYSLPAFGAWMAAQGTKRPTEALVVGAALRVAAGTLDPAACGVTHVPLACDSDGDGDAMWAWAAQWAGAVRASAAGKVVTLLLEAGARTPARSLRLHLVLVLALVVVLALALTRTLAQTLTQPVGRRATARALAHRRRARRAPRRHRAADRLYSARGWPIGRACSLATARATRDRHHSSEGGIDR